MDIRESDPGAKTHPLTLKGMAVFKQTRDIKNLYVIIQKYWFVFLVSNNQ